MISVWELFYQVPDMFSDVVKEMSATANKLVSSSHPDSKKIKSSVTSLELKNGNAGINVSNLDNDIEIVIPISSPPQNSSNGTEHFFHTLNIHIHCTDV